MTITLLQMAEKVLEEEKRALSAWEIWQVAENNGLDRLVESNGKTAAASLSTLIYADIRDNPSSVFFHLSDRPNRYMLKSQLDKIRPGKKVRILEHVINIVDDFTNIAIVDATKDSIGTILSFEEYKADVDDNVRRSLNVHPGHLAWVKSVMEARTSYPIKFDEIVPLSDDDFAKLEQEYLVVEVSCQVGGTMILPTKSFVII